MSQKIWNVYLSGEIHTDWRERIIDGATKASSVSYTHLTLPTSDLV